MRSEDRKPTLRPVPALPAKPLEERVGELERAVAMLIRHDPMFAPSPFALEAAAPAWEIRLPTVDELEYATWAFLCAASFLVLLRCAR